MTAEPAAEAGNYRFASSAYLGETTLCSQEPTFGGFEQYDFGVLNEEIRLNPAVAEEAGVTEVASCEDARRFSEVAQRSKELDMELSEPPGVEPDVAGGVGQLRQPMAGGNVSGAYGMVQLWGGGCTGFIFAENTIVTAAHCLPGRSGTFQPSIKYFHPSGAYSLNKSGQVFTYRQHPNWTGGLEPRYDVGIIVSSTKLAVGNKDTLPILWGDPRVIGQGRYYGSGYFDYQMRNWPFHLDWTSSDYLYTITRATKSTQLCVGDSGGAGTLIMAGGRTVSSVNHGVDFSSGGRCACIGCKQRHAVILPAITNWIIQQAGLSCVWDPDYELQQSYVSCWKNF